MLSNRRTREHSRDMGSGCSESRYRGCRFQQQWFVNCRADTASRLTVTAHRNRLPIQNARSRPRCAGVRSGSVFESGHRGRGTRSCFDPSHLTYRKCTNFNAHAANEFLERGQGRNGSPATFSGKIGRVAQFSVDRNMYTCILKQDGRRVFTYPARNTLLTRSHRRTEDVYAPPTPGLSVFGAFLRDDRKRRLT